MDGKGAIEVAGISRLGESREMGAGGSVRLRSARERAPSSQ